jgi:hypothetical protein
MKRLGKYTLAALMLAGSTLGVTLATTAPANAHVSVGIGIGIPGPGYYRGGYYGGGYGGGYYGGGYDNSPCASPRFRYYHPDYCGYPSYYGSSYYGPGIVDGFWFTDSFGNRSWRGGGGHWGGQSGGHWSGGGHHH